ncbi:hypothetical protein Tco_1035734 [Tanacetum coccineum]
MKETAHNPIPRIKGFVLLGACELIMEWFGTEQIVAKGKVYLSISNVYCGEKAREMMLSKSANVLGVLDGVASEALDLTGFYYSGKPPVLRKNPSNSVGQALQDPTNDAQYAYGLAALGHQLHAMGLIDNPMVYPDISIATALMDIYFHYSLHLEMSTRAGDDLVPEGYLHGDLKEELKEELKVKLQEEMKNERKEEMREELKEEVREELKE